MQKKKFYSISCVVLIAVFLVIVSVTVACSFGKNVNFEGFTIVTAALIAVAAFTAASLFWYQSKNYNGLKNKAFVLKKIGFWLLHIGVIVTLAGFAGFDIFGDKITASVPVGGDTYYRNIQRSHENNEVYDSEREIVDLGFNFNIKSFETELYEDGSAKQYRCSISFFDEISLRETVHELSVNNPVCQGGWKIYLMSCNGGNVYLMFRHDPFEAVTKAGICMLILGCVSSLILGNLFSDVSGSRKFKENDGIGKNDGMRRKKL